MDETLAAWPTDAKRRGARLRRAGLIIAVIAGLALFLGACGGSSAGSGGPGSAPSGPQNGHFLISGADQNNPNFNSAVQTCQHLLGPGGATNGGGSNNSQLLAFAKCMQTHGVPQFPDPTANGGIGLPQGVDPNSPQFQKAWKECQSKLPGSLQGQQP
jgi:hypothetical protein